MYKRQVLIGLVEDLPEKEERYEPEQISDILDMEVEEVREIMENE